MLILNSVERHGNNRRSLYFGKLLSYLVNRESLGIHAIQDQFTDIDGSMED